MTGPARVEPITALLMALTVMMSATILAVIYLVAFIEPAAPLASDPPLAGSDMRCDASSLEAMICPANHYCSLDTCVPDELPGACGEGESCRDCECADGLVCHHHRCLDPQHVDRTPLICKDERVGRAVKRLAEMCASRRKSLDDIVSSGSCSVADWEALAIEDERFDLLLAAFPDRFAVHFPIGKPSPARRDWPAEEQREFLRDQLRGYREPLAAAKQIFVIGRASPDGHPESNHLLALTRMNLVSDLIQSVIYEGIPETRRDELRVRIRSFTLPTTAPIRPEKYVHNYLASQPGTIPLDREPLMAWDADSLGELERKLADPILLAERGSPEYQRLLNAVNRVVLVIPVPCLGDEYAPRLTDIAGSGANGGSP